VANIVLRVNGGIMAFGWIMQRFADFRDAPVDRPMVQETTALGTASAPLNNYIGCRN
jgi:glycerol kinase